MQFGERGREGGRDREREKERGEREREDILRTMIMNKKCQTRNFLASSGVPTEKVFERSKRFPFQILIKFD